MGIIENIYLHGRIYDSGCRVNKLAPYIQLYRFFEERDFVLLGRGFPVPSIECVIGMPVRSTEIHKRNKQSECLFCYCH